MADGKPVDLTTMGAAVELPPRDHPIFDGYFEAPSLHMSSQEMAFKIWQLENRVTQLEQERWQKMT